MLLSLKDNLPFTSVILCYQDHTLEISNVLVDTGSASTIFAADVVFNIQIAPSADDVLHTIQGVGGSEVVFTRRVDYLKLGEQSLKNFEIEVGGMDYGFEINGILGMDFLVQAGVVINLHEFSIEFNHR